MVVLSACSLLPNSNPWMLRRIGYTSIVCTYWAIFIWLLCWINNDYRRRCSAWKMRGVGTSIGVIKFDNNNKRQSHRNLSEIQSRIEVRIRFMVTTLLFSPRIRMLGIENELSFNGRHRASNWHHRESDVHNQNNIRLALNNIQIKFLFIAGWILWLLIPTGSW